MNEIKTVLLEQLNYLSKYAKDSKHTGNDVTNMTDKYDIAFKSN